MTKSRLPATLRDEIARTATPVRPLAPPLLRLAPVISWALGSFVLVSLIWGWREDFEAVGPWRLWGASVVQVFLALAVAATALTESIPGRLASMRTVMTLASLGVGLFLVTTTLTFAGSATLMPPGLALTYFWICVTRPFLLGVPALAVLILLGARGLTSRPAIAGALAGLAAGLASDASWRTYCQVSDPGHVLVAHAGAIAVLTALGAGLGAGVASRGRSG